MSQKPMPFYVLLLVLLVLGTPAWPARAQQQPPPQDASDQQAPKTKDAKKAQDAQDKDKPGDAVGKSKLEKETGTVNDRIFEVMPNYGTVEAANELPPLSTGQKYRIASASVFD